MESIFYLLPITPYLLPLTLSHHRAIKFIFQQKMSQNNPVYPVIWHNNSVSLIDQTRLPLEYSYVEIHRSEDMAQAIKTMIVRGAPAIGVAAAYGMYLGAREIETSDPNEFLNRLEQVAQMLRETRPTAVNLFWAISRIIKTAYESIGTVDEIRNTLLETAQAINSEDLQKNFYIDEKINLMRLMLHPQGLKPFVSNWEEIVSHLIKRVYREAIADDNNKQPRQLYQELMTYPDVPQLWKLSHTQTWQIPLLTVKFFKDGLNLNFFSAIATLGTPQDIMLQELRIETLFPADEITQKNLQKLN